MALGSVHNLNVPRRIAGVLLLRHPIIILCITTNSRLVWTLTPVIVMLLNRPAALIDEDTNATLAHSLLIREWDLAHSWPAARLTLVEILGLLHH